MKCYYHKSKEADYSCKLCNHPLCKDCVEEIKGQYYCKDCLEDLVREKEEVVEEKKRPPKSPGVAALLSIIPGLGQIYNGQIIKGIGIFFLFASIAAIAENYPEGPFLPLLAIAVYAGAIADAYRTAKQLNLRAKGLAQDEPLGLIPEGSIWWGLILIVVGALFLLHNFGFRLYWISDLWPLIIIGIGIYLLRGFFIKSKKEKEESNLEEGEKK